MAQFSYIAKFATPAGPLYMSFKAEGKELARDHAEHVARDPEFHGEVKVVSVTRLHGLPSEPMGRMVKVETDLL